MTGVIATIQRIQFFNGLGQPLAGGKLYTYAAGTTTPASTYQDQALTIQNENPIPLDSTGSCIIWLDPAKSYKFALKSKTGVTQPGWPVDNVSGAATLTSLASTLSQYAKSANLAAAGGSALMGFIQVGADAVERTVEDELRDRPSIKQFGALGDGTDDTAAIAAAAVEFPVSVVPPGDFLYKAAVTDDASKFDFRQGADFVGMKNLTTSITARDVNGNVLGIQQNYLEQTSAATPITTGWIPWAPLSNKSPTTSVDLLAHWYNDTGLECVRAAGGAIGSVKWYTGEWNHTTNTEYGTYDPKRHPMLGWYRGDDPKVLDWQCYWLREYGIKAVILVTEDGFDTGAWSNPLDTNRGYWLYQLFNNTPNFKGLGYIFDGPFQGITAAQATDRWNKITDLYLAHPHFYVANIDGGLYPCIYIFDAGTMRTAVFGGDDPFETWLKSIATKFKNAGYAGVCVMARNGTYYTNTADSTVADRYARAFYGTGVVIFESTYAWSGAPFGNPTTYDGFVDAFDATYAANKNRVIPNVMTSRESKYHPTGWTTTGSTPEKFGKVLRKAVQAVRNNTTVPRWVTIYNVAEWGEGGAGLQPNMADGFGYLQQCRTVDTVAAQRGTDLFTYKKQVNSGTGIAGNNIKPIGDVVYIYSSIGITLASLYTAYAGGTIAPGYPNQKIKLVNSADAGNNVINLCDVSNFAGSGLHLAAAQISLNAWNSVELTYISGRGWQQTSSVIAPL
jgi:hypothetical protein